MISRHRLRGRRRFAAVRAHGVRASSGGLRLQVAGNDLGVGRVGFALVGLRSAVVRNLLRRRLRAAIGPSLGDLAGRDVVVVAGAEALELSFVDLSAALSASLSRGIRRLDGATALPAADNVSMPRAAQTPE